MRDAQVHLHGTHRSDIFLPEQWLACCGARRSEGSTARLSKLIELRPATQLADLGITKTQSSRWQKLAGIDDQAFERRVADIWSHTCAANGRFGACRVGASNPKPASDLAEADP